MSSIPPPSTPPPPTPGPSTSSTTTPPSSPPPPPPPPPPTSSTTTTTSLPITTTSDVTSTTTPILTSSTTTPILPTLSTTTPLPTSTSALITSPTVGAFTTIISVTTTTSPRNVAPTGTLDSSSTGNKGFFHNTGAVAGVFTVVGLIVLAIIIALITNCIRRRRAQKFDDEIAAAARDAANAQVPNFGYEDDDEFRHAGYGAGATGAVGAAGVGGSKYSDMSHGTYAQPPMSIPESYGMRELPHQGLGPHPGEYFDSSPSNAYGAGAAAAGAAGVGVARARSMRDGGYAAGLTEGSSPYAAFAAAPGGGGRNGNGNGPQYPPGMIRGAGNPEFDLHRRPSQYTQQQQQQPTDYAALARNKSQHTTASGSAPSYQSDPNNNGGYGGYPNSFGAYATSSPPPGVVTPGAGAASGKHLQPIPSSRSEENLDEAYGGYVDDDEPHHSGYSPQLPNPFSTAAATHHPPPAGRHGEYVDDSEDEVEEPRRILKVANE